MAKLATRGQHKSKARHSPKKEDSLEKVSRVIGLIFGIAMALVFVGVLVYLGPIILGWMFENGLTRPIVEP